MTIEDKNELDERPSPTLQDKLHAARIALMHFILLGVIMCLVVLGVTVIFVTFFVALGNVMDLSKQSKLVVFFSLCGVLLFLSTLLIISETYSSVLYKHLSTKSDNPATLELRRHLKRLTELKKRLGRIDELTLAQIRSQFEEVQEVLASSATRAEKELEFLAVLKTEIEHASQKKSEAEQQVKLLSQTKEEAVLALMSGFAHDFQKRQRKSRYLDWTMGLILGFFASILAGYVMELDSSWPWTPIPEVQTEPHELENITLPFSDRKVISPPYSSS